MTRKKLPALFFGLIAWIGLGSFANHYFCCAPATAVTAAASTATVAGSASTAAAASSAVAASGAAASSISGGASSAALLSILDGNVVVGKSLTQGISFAKSSASFISPLHRDVNGALNQTAAYLKRNGNKKLTITGRYDVNEKNNSTAENLGLARAESVQNVIVQMGVPQNQIALSGIAKRNLNWNKKNQVASAVSFSIQ